MQPKQPKDSVQSVKEMSDAELIEALQTTLGELDRVAQRALADARAGKYVDPVALDHLRGEIDDDELDELEELNAKRLD
jgi:hypothetical protein